MIQAASEKRLTGDRWEEIEDRFLKPASDEEKAANYERDVTDLMAEIQALCRINERLNQECVANDRRRADTP